MAKTVFSKSPYFVNVNETNLVYCSINVWIYTGTQTTDRPAQPNYQLRSTAINETVSFEIGSLVNDAIQYPADSTYRTDGAWMDYEVTRYYSDSTSATSSIVQLYAVDGYTYFNEGSNYDPRIGLTTSVNEIFAPTGEVVRIPLNKRQAMFYSHYEGGATATYKASLHNTDQSDGQFVYLNINNDNVTNAVVETVRGNLFNNGTFSDGTTGLTAVNSANISINSSNELVIERTSGVTGDAVEIELEGLEVGKTYKVSVIVTAADAGRDLALRWDDASGTDDLGTIWEEGVDSTTARVNGEFQPTETDGTLTIKVMQGTGSVTIDNLFIQDTNYTDYIDTYRITRDRESCYSSYEPIKVKFVNRYGAMEDLFFMKRNKKTTEIDAQTYQNNQILSNGAYNTYDHQMRRFNVTSKETLMINSGFTKEDMNEAYVQLLQSSKAWMEYEGSLYPINIKTSSMSHKTTRDDRLINYELEVEFAFNKINTVR
jgi:hypothetical protein